jgi:hypothetical protein
MGADAREAARDDVRGASRAASIGVEDLGDRFGHIGSVATHKARQNGPGDRVRCLFAPSPGGFAMGIDMSLYAGSASGIT